MTLQSFRRPVLLGIAMGGIFVASGFFIHSSALAGGPANVWQQSDLAETPAPASSAKLSGASGENSTAGKLARRQAPGLTGRLPRYYASVVTAAQRKSIYQIQTAYRARIQDLQKQLDELKQIQLEEMNAVLSAEQLQKINVLREQGAARAGQSAQDTASQSATQKKEEIEVAIPAGSE